MSVKPKSLGCIFHRNKSLDRAFNLFGTQEVVKVITDELKKNPAASFQQAQDAQKDVDDAVKDAEETEVIATGVEEVAKKAEDDD